jgi:Domain of unknown function (DUF4832)/Domain of unknown function (DUF4874)
MMKTNALYKIFFPAALLFCMAGCKKTETVTPPPVDDGVKYEISNTIFPNPERGFVRMMDVHSEGASLNAAQINTFRNQNVSMIIRVFYLEAFRNQALSTAQLTLIQEDLDKIRNAGLKAILRFAYSDNIGVDDAPLAIIEQHLDQLQPIFTNNKDVIAFVQAGLIGAWGEWHSSSNGLATIENETTVLNKLLSVLPADIMVQVRTPGAKQSIFNTTDAITAAIAYTNEAKARVGHHNDCFMSGGDNYGTYSNITLQKQYISNEALFVPTGGETCPPTGGYDPSCNEGRNEMKLLKWTYLNLDWYQPTVNAWKTSGCFDEFQRNLGYRLALVDAKFPAAATVNGSITPTVNIINKGYAPLYHKKDVYLVFKNKTSGAYYEKMLAADLRLCKPEQTKSIGEAINLSGIPAGDYDLYLRIADKAASLKTRTEYAIQLANTGVWVTENGGMNNLKKVLKIN